MAEMTKEESRGLGYLIGMIFVSFAVGMMQGLPWGLLAFGALAIFSVLWDELLEKIGK